MTGIEIFNTAMDLCALRTVNGTVPNDCLDLRQRALGLLNILIAENAFLDSLIKKSEMVIGKIDALDDTVELSAILCSAVMPYGLAFLLMLDENPQSASIFSKKYQEQLINIRASLKGALLPVKEVY